MSLAAVSSSSLADRLPSVRGRYSFDVPLAPLTWFRVGGPADVVYKPADLADLQSFLSACPLDIPVTVIGVASNLLVRDGGVDGVVIRLGGSFAGISTNGQEITAGAGALDLNVALTAQQAGLAGLEFLSGIPGTIGGALRMNAGAYGREVKDCLMRTRAVDRSGVLHTFTHDAITFGHRFCSLPQDLIFIDATFSTTPDTPEAISARMDAIKAKREASQPIRSRTGGSTFANPEGGKAWELVDKVGGRGLRRGGAMFSTQHTNFLINDNNASAADLEDLGEDVRARVKEQFGISLRWEIQRIGHRPKEES